MHCGVFDGDHSVIVLGQFMGNLSGVCLAEFDWPLGLIGSSFAAVSVSVCCLSINYYKVIILVRKLID